MKLKIALAVVALVLLAGIWSVTLGGWREMNVASVRLRYHILSGRMEMLRDDRWMPPFVDDPRAPTVSKRDLESVTLDSLAWGVGGLLVGRATCDLDTPIRGRIAIAIRILEPSGARVRERTLRVTADWPAGKATWFVLDTGLSAPDPRQKTIVTLESIL